jgi:thiosulfate dehydrogenase [quinone] large subunit
LIVCKQGEIKMKNIVTHKGTIVEDPPFVQKLFNENRFSWLWLVLRIWLGYNWVDAALHKIDNPAWVQTGEALKGFWQGAVAIPEGGRPAISFGWYRSFIQFLLDTESYTWFAKLVAYGELLIGIALILGLFTGIAAFMGGSLNWNFIMAGSASSNGMLFFISVLLILAWKVAGWIGLDHFVLPLIGTPWGDKSAEPVVPAPPSGETVVVTTKA